ncbi:BTB/POZ domain-containing protein [Fusarium oxysporum f. sp. phaseoli]
MQYSKADRNIVYRSSRCKQIFSIPENLALRKQKAIRAVVQRHNLTVSNFPRDKLVRILQCLLQQGVFSSYSTAKVVISEPASWPTVQQEPQRVLRPLSPDRDRCIMEEHRAWMKDLFHTGKYSDIDLISDTKLYEAHRSIVCSMSPVIDRSCEFNAAKLDRVEPQGNGSDHRTARASFNFGDADPEADILREDDDYSPVTDKATTLEARLLILHAKVFTLAHMYDTPRPRAPCIKKSKGAAQQQRKPSYPLDAAREAYTATPTDILEMRKAIVEIFYENRALLDESRVQAFLLEIPQLILDIALYMNKPPTSFGDRGYKWI